MPSLEALRSHGRGSSVSGSPGSMASAAAIASSRRPAAQDGNRSSSNSRASSLARMPSEDKPLASGNGVSMAINLAEPVLFLQGFDQNDSSTHSTAMLRGNLHLRVSKNAKIKAITLKFKGTAVTRWPEGIPPKRVDFDEVDTLMSHTWPFFNAQFPAAEGGSCADVVRLVGGSTETASSQHPSFSTLGPSSTANASRDAKRLALSAAQSRSFEKTDQKPASSVATKGYRTFYPGEYIYNFELPLDSRLPETIDVDLGSVRYELEAVIERAGAFRANLAGVKEVPLIRAPAEGSLEQVEPIAISRNWEDQLHYDIVISGKSFPLGSKVPIAFKLTPLAKVQCHRIKVFVTENTEYFCSGKRVHRMEPTRKVPLFEKRADSHSVSEYPGSTMRIISGGGVPYDQREAAARGDEIATNDQSNLLGRLEGETNIGPTEMEFNVQLPGCSNSAADPRERVRRLHFDTTYQNIQVHHWIKIVMRLSKPDKVDPTRRRHFEISIDSPFHILSCRASQANTSLPAYSIPNAHLVHGESQADCGCPGAPKRRISPTYVPTLNAFNDGASAGSGVWNDASRESSISSDASSLTRAGSSTIAHDRGTLARPQQAHVAGTNGAIQRPIHMLRAPSFNPPAFEDDQPPPPLITPPPQYDDIASPNHGLADYFSRLADAYDDIEDSDDDVRSATRRGRVNIPLTPGSRINRSMDLQRTWLPVGQT